MWKPLLIVASLGLLAVAPLGCHGGDPAKKAERMKKYVTWQLDDQLDSIDATDAQRQQVAKVRDQMFAEAAPLAEGHKAARAELLAQLEAPRPDAPRLHALVDERIEAARAVAHKLTDAVVELHGAFTPEQRAKLAGNIRASCGAR
ncbi:MAG: Spy/CpxP family protein refolding chaperone [Myxococcaceae bacterium]